MTEPVAPQTSCPFFRLAELERREILRSCAGKLTKRQRTLLYFRYDWGLSFVEIAARFDQTPEAVSSMHKRILPTLRAELASRKLTDIGNLL